jgi:sulfate adenylyltransferase subunit 1 (EFTu-like GTPase family)
MVVRPDDQFRGYAGQIVSGTIKPGDRVTAWPSGRSARVKRIVTFDGDLALGFAPMSVTLTLDDEIDISRGDVLTKEAAFVGQKFEAELVWMDERPLDPGRVYLLKHSTRTVTAEVNHALVLNQIGTVQITTARPLVFDRYTENRGTGSFILIDPATQFTCGAGMITEPLRELSEAHNAPLSFAERLAHIARRAGSDEEAAELVRKALEEMLT